MLSKRVFFFACFTCLALSSLARSESPAQSSRFTLQVAAFPDAAAAAKFLSRLTQSGERPVYGAVNIPGRGVWVRVYLGAFANAEAARRYGQRLVARKAVEEFLVKPYREVQLLLAGNHTKVAGERTTPAQEPQEPEDLPAPVSSQSTVEVNLPSGNFGPRPASNKYRRNKSRKVGPVSLDSAVALIFFKDSEMVARLLPVTERVSPALAPSTDISSIPRPDPTALAFGLALGKNRAVNKQRGGLWLSGNIAEGLERLRWIAGDENAHLLCLDQNGQVHLDARLLARLAEADDKTAFAAPLKVAQYIAANEGLLLLAQLTQGAHRYRLHIGAHAPTYNETVAVSASLNLDNNYDSRINPYRRQGKKLDRELPPKGFDSLVAINPTARWFNLRSKAFVHPGTITFHELAEAYAKLALGLDYLPQDYLPGAHNIAVERETILQAQRPFSGMVVTSGSNRVLRSEAEYRQFSSESGQR